MAALTADVLRQARAVVAEELVEAARHAARQPYVIERFTDDDPTDWTRAHRYVDGLLEDLEALR